MHGMVQNSGNDGYEKENDSTKLLGDEYRNWDSWHSWCRRRENLLRKQLVKLVSYSDNRGNIYLAL